MTLVSPPDGSDDSIPGWCARYIDRGFSIHPIRARSKEPAGPWKRAQTDRISIEATREWRRQYGNHGIGIVTGQISGIVVIDIDDLALHANFMAELPPTAIAATSKGRHYYYKLPPNVVIPKCRPFDKMDVQGEGGYVVAPPSLHAAGLVHYSWITPLDDMVEIPLWLIDKIKPRPLAQVADERKRTDWEIALDGVAEGKGRNNAATKVVGKLFENAPPQMWPILWGALEQWNQRNTPPLAIKELRATYESVERKESAKRALIDEKRQKITYLDETENFEAEAREEIVANFLVAGMTLLIGKPKRGKSVFLMQVCLAIASGQVIFRDRLRAATAPKQYTVKQHELLYIALEDDEHRFITRARMLYGAKKLPAGFGFANAWRPLKMGGLDDLERYMFERPATKVIVIDTLSAFISGSVESKNGNAFKADYEQARPIFDFAIKYDVGVIVVHHARKTPSGWSEDDDPMDAISGTLGAAAVVDTFMYFDRNLHSEHVLLHIAGRDIAASVQALQQKPQEDSNNRILPRFEIGDFEALKAERKKKKR